MNTERKEYTKDIVVIGAGITGLTTAYWLKKGGKDVEVLEKEERFGGQIHTFHVDGYLFESGPNTGVLSSPEAVELFNSIAADCQVDIARSSAKRRLVWKKDSFTALPTSLSTAITTPLFTTYDKLRILGEPFRAKGSDPNESVADMVKRRLGNSYYNYAVDPFIAGIYAGDPTKLITRYALPKLYQLEQNYGSFIRGAIKKAKEKKGERERLATKDVFSPNHGMEQIVKALAKNIDEKNIVLGANNLSVAPQEDGSYSVTYTNSQGNECVVRANKVITTCGAYALPQVLPFVTEAEKQALSNLTYAPVVQVGVGIKYVNNHTLNAFGGLVPTIEQQKLLGVLFTSACFDNRAPQNSTTLSFFLGGMKDQDMVNKSDEEIVSLVKDALHRMLKVPNDVEIEAIKISRHQRAIPQYWANTEERIKAVQAVEQRYKGLIVAGNLRDGIGIADRIKQGTLVAQSILG